MKKIKLKNGFECELDDNIMNNMELVDTLAEEDDNNPLTVSKLCRLIFGNGDTREALYDSLRHPDGRVPVEELAKAIKETFEQFGDAGKKSSSSQE
jgi:hypothetical protein